jgi:hypothetical protein
MLRNQVHLISFVKYVIDNAEPSSFNQLILARTKQEEEGISRANQIPDENDRKRELGKIDWNYWQRRLLNGEYFRQIFMILNPI